MAENEREHLEGDDKYEDLGGKETGKVCKVNIANSPGTYKRSREHYHGNKKRR